MHANGMATQKRARIKAHLLAFTDLHIYTLLYTKHIYIHIRKSPEQSKTQLLFPVATLFTEILWTNTSQLFTSRYL